jgi:hypothetical protein
MAMLLRQLPVLALALVLPRTLSSQVDTTATISGRAASSLNGRPLAGVMISVPAARKLIVTDSTGRFTLDGLPAGRQKVRISFDGRATEEHEFELRARRTRRLNVLLDVEALDLAAIVVEAKAVHGLGAFYDRKKFYSGFADFYTREDIERIRPMMISDLLRRSGVWVRCDPQCVPTQMHHGFLCVVPVSVDGTPFWDFDFDNVRVDDVAGVEVYRETPLGTPFGSAQRSLAERARDPRTYQPFQRRGSCGSIQIWTRR